MSDPDGNGGLMPDCVGERVRASGSEGERVQPPGGGRGADPGFGSGKRRKRRRRSNGKRNGAIALGDTGFRKDNINKNGVTKDHFERGDVPSDGSPPESLSQETRSSHTGRTDRSTVEPTRGEPASVERDATGNGGQRPNGKRPFRRAVNGTGANGAPRRGVRPSPAGARRELYGALDLGTNNCRLLIAEPRGRGFRVVDAFSRIVRLGEGVSRNGTLGSDAMDRAIEALRICRRKLEFRGVRKARFVATEACRAATNGKAFLDRVRAETDLELEVLPRGVEARLAVLGCSPLIDQRDDAALLFDIGGGSSEIAWIDLKKRHRDKRCSVADCILSWTSLPVGVVTLSEKFGGEHVTPQVFEDMILHVDELLEDAGKWGLLDRAIAAGRAHFIGTSGTVTTIAGVHLALDRYDRRMVDGIWLNDGKIDAVMKMMLAMSYPERVGNACIGADRADLVLAGCAILEAIRRRWPCRRLRVADRGLREGILLELMTADGVWPRRHGN